MELNINIKDKKSAIELASFCGGFLATNKGRACITPIIQDIFVQILSQLAPTEKKLIESDIKEMLTRTESMKRLAEKMENKQIGVIEG